jgi:hypothetical protein
MGRLPEGVDRPGRDPRAAGADGTDTSVTVSPTLS